MNNILFQNETIEINGISRSFSYTIKKIIEIEEYIVVLLKIPPNAMSNRNVFCLDLKNSIIWQIDEPVYAIGKDSPFTDIWMDENTKEIYCYNWYGVSHLVVNMNNGMIDSGVLTK
jgi:hypothetical protein